MVYVPSLIKKLGLDENTTNTNNTYIQVRKTGNISDHIKFLESKFNLEVDEENKKDPSIHRKPTSKTRFIIAGP